MTPFSIRHEHPVDPLIVDILRSVAEAASHPWRDLADRRLCVNARMSKNVQYDYAGNDQGNADQCRGIELLPNNIHPTIDTRTIPTPDHIA